jgi:phosphoribosylglycinamide formyltransferase 1
LIENINKLEIDKDHKAALPEQPLHTLVVLASGAGSNLQAILDACRSGEIEARVVAVVSDQPQAFALERARQAEIPAVVFPWKPYREAGRSRRDYDASLAARLAEFEPDWVILAGWMRLLGREFLDCFPMRVINLHPALPGSFPGTDAIRRAWEAFCAGKISATGVMIHYVPDEGVDDGPLIAQESVSIYPTDTLESLSERIHSVEHRLLVQTIRDLTKKPSGR